MSKELSDIERKEKKLKGIWYDTSGEYEYTLICPLCGANVMASRKATHSEWHMKAGV